MYPISSAPFYMAMNKKMLEDAGCKPCKEGGQLMTLKSIESKGKGIHQVHCSVLVKGGTKDVPHL